ncbi:MAG: hypothetical protein K8S97_00020 [Anaerolineae bacterium]|nr:hypothetical protein [Anaerolineae bacterium]
MLAILVATLVMALVISVNDNFPALIYAVIASRATSPQNWLVITVSFFVYYLYQVVARSVRG